MTLQIISRIEHLVPSYNIIERVWDFSLSIK